jgi:hypothetical protein
VTLLELVDDWLRDSVVSGLALLSLLGVVAVAFTADEPVWTALGVLAGMVATVALFVPLARHWSPGSTWVTMVTVAAFDVAVILVLLGA